MKYRAKFLATCMLLLAAPVLATPPPTTGIVQAGDEKAFARGIPALGFVADEAGHVIAPVERQYSHLFIHLADGTEHIARRLAHDSVSGLALLKLSGTGSHPVPYRFAKDPAQQGRKVYGAAIDSGTVQFVSGSVTSVVASASDSKPGKILHNALVGKQSHGSLLTNNCGEVIGVIIDKPKSSFFAGLFGGEEKSEGHAFAIPSSWLLQVFEKHGLKPVMADTACISEAAQREAAEKEAAEAKAQAEKEKAERAAAEKRAKEAQTQAEQAAKEKKAAEEKAAATARKAEEMKAQAEKQEAERKKAEEKAATAAKETEKKEAERKAAEEKATAAAEEAKKKEAERKAAEEKAAAAAKEAEETKTRMEQEAKEKEKQILLWALIAGIVLLLVLLLIWRINRRSVARAGKQAEEAQEELEEQKEREERIRKIPDVFLEGSDAEGQRVAVRIPGSSLAKAEGAVVGRNPSESEFVINHAEVSRQHFRLFAWEGSIMVEDLNSMNGTEVNGKVLGPDETSALKADDSLKVGGLALTVNLERNEG